MNTIVSTQRNNVKRTVRMIRTAKMIIAFALMLILLTSCKEGDDNYAASEEQYLIGHVLRNVDDNTPSVIDFRQQNDKINEYDYEFNYPAFNPEYFRNVLFFYEPDWFIAGTSQNKIAVPLKRKYYVFADDSQKAVYGDNIWGFQNYQHVNYLNQKDFSMPEETDKYFMQFLLDVNQEESGNYVFPLLDQPEEKSFGTAPYRLDNLIVSNDFIYFEGGLIRANKGTVFLKKETDLQEIQLEKPKYEIHRNNELVEKGNLTDEYSVWTRLFVSEKAREDGSYHVKMEIPTYYPVFERIYLQYEFTKPQEDIQPPFINFIDIPSRFEKDNQVVVRVNVSDNSIASANIYYSTDNNPDSWVELSTEIESEEKSTLDKIVYKAGITVTDDSKKMNLRIVVLDASGNKAEAIVKSASLRARQVSLNLKSDKTTAAKGDKILFSGRCIDDTGDDCRGIRLIYYLNDEKIGHDITDDIRTDEYDDKGKYLEHKYLPADFSYELQVPHDYAADNIKFSAEFEGAGIYLPKKEEISVSMGAFERDISITKINVPVLILDKETEITADVANVGKQTEENVAVMLFVDEELIDTKNVESIESEEKKTVSFTYKPTTTREKLIKIISSLSGDENPNNDEKEERRDVFSTAPDVIVNINSNFKIIANSTNNITVLLGNGRGEKAENVTVEFYDIYNDMNYWIRDEVKTEEFQGKTYTVAIIETGKKGANFSIEYVHLDSSIKEEFYLEEFEGERSFSQIHRLQDGNALALEAIYDNGIDPRLIAYSIGNLNYEEKLVIEIPSFSTKEEVFNFKTDAKVLHRIKAFGNIESDADYYNNLGYKEIRIVEDKADLIATEINVIGADFSTNWNSLLGKEYNVSIKIYNDGLRKSQETTGEFSDFYALMTSFIPYSEEERIIHEGKEYFIKVENKGGKKLAEAEITIEHEGITYVYSLKLGEIREIQNGIGVRLLRMYDYGSMIQLGFIKKSIVSVPALNKEQLHEIIIKGWKPNRTGEHILTFKINSIDDNDYTNDAAFSGEYVVRDGSDLRAQKEFMDDFNTATIGKEKVFNYTILNAGIRNATDAAAIFYDMFNLSFVRVDVRDDEKIENAVVHEDIQYIVSVKLIELTEEEQTETSKKIAEFEIQYESEGENVIEQFKLRRGNIYELRNGKLFAAEFYSDNSDTIYARLGDGHIIVYEIGQIGINEEKELKVAWTPNELGEHYLLLSLNASNDANLDNNGFVDYYDVLADGPDLTAEFERAAINDEYYSLSVADEPYTVTVEIFNLGSAASEDASLEIYANAHDEYSEIIQKTVPAEELKESANAKGSSGGGSGGGGHGDGVNIVPREYNEVLVATKQLGRIETGESVKINSTFMLNETGGYAFRAFVNESKDIRQWNNKAVHYVKSIDDAAYIVMESEVEYPAILDKNARVDIKLRNVMPHKAENVMLYMFEREESNLRYNKGNRDIEERYEVNTSLFEKISVGTINENSAREISLNWTPRKYFSYMLIPFVNYTSNGKTYEKEQRLVTQAKVNSSDVVVYNIDTQQLMEVNNAHRIEVRLYNQGLQSAEDIKVKLYANDVMIGEKIMTLRSGQDDDVEFFWTPIIEDNYILKAAAETNDFASENNEITTEVAAGRVLDVEVNITDASGNALSREVYAGYDPYNVFGSRKIKVNTRIKELAILSGKGSIFVYEEPAVQEKLRAVEQQFSVSKSEHQVHLKKIFANKINWDYARVYFKAVFHENIDTANTEIFHCAEFDFINASCAGRWKKTALYELESTNDGIYAEAIAPKAEAFALGLRDLDNDGIPDAYDDDDDNDGIADNEDKVRGNSTQINTNIAKLRMRIANSTEINKRFNKTEVVEFVKDNKPRLEFRHNFSNKALDISNLAIEEKADNISGGILIRGLELEQNETKSAYIDDISISNEVCIKDMEIESLSNITQGCTGENETLLFCPGNALVDGRNYSCGIITANGSTLYKISGLRNSGVQELADCIEQWNCGEWGSCSSNKQSRTCTDAKQCGTTANKPAIEQSCGSGDFGSRFGSGSSSSGSSKTSRERAGNTFSLGIIQAEQSKEVGMLDNDIAKFRLETKEYSLKLEQPYEKSAEISISPVYSSVTVQTGKGLSLDLNSNNIDDFRVTITKIENGKVTFKLMNIGETAEQRILPRAGRNDTIAATDESIAPVVPKITKKDENVDDNTILKGYALLAVSLLTFIGVMLFVFREQEKRRNGTKEHTMHSQAGAHHEVIEMFVKQLKEKDYSREKIVEELSRKGWHPREVMHVIKAHEMKQMHGNIDALAGFIERNVNKGYTRRQIAKAMHDKGWPKEAIIKAFREEKKLRKYIK